MIHKPLTPLCSIRPYIEAYNIRAVGSPCFLDCFTNFFEQFLSLSSVKQSEKVLVMSDRKEFSSLIPTPCSSTGMADQFMVIDWNPLVSMDHNVDFDGSSSSIMAERFPKPSAFANDRFPKNSFDLRKTTTMVPSALCVPDIHSTERNLKGKKRKPESGSLNQNAEAEQKKNVSPDSVESPTDIGERKPKSENSGGSSHMLAPKEDYIHVRAKRGQATNSHSLAERVRREKISERMRLLQDLVPGCNKITGKAMMLDEIINYVQSLQRQVEFLSMKLAAVNPELDFDIEQMVSKDMFHSRSGGLAAFECSSGMNTLRPHFLGSSPHGIMQSEMLMSDLHNSANMLRSTISQLPVVWDDELHNALQMGFIPNPALVASDPNDSMKI